MALDVQPKGDRSRALFLLVLAALCALFWVVSDTPQVALVFLPVIPVALRLALARAHIDGERLTGRNFWSSFELHRSEITGFDVEDQWRSRLGRQRLVYARLVTGHSQRLSATRRTYTKFPAWRPRRQKRNEADSICDQLNAWLRTGI